MNNKEWLKEALIESLNECIALNQRPDEYQQRHNRLIRRLAAYVLRDDFDIGIEEEND